MTGLAVGVIGAGGMGSRHAGNLHRHVGGASVAAVVDADRDRASRVAGACGGAAVFDDARELIASSAVDAVVIASPDDTHAELALACIESGKPVLCEKPLGTTVAEARHVVDAEVAAGRRLVQVGFMRYFDPAHTAVKERIDAGDVGRPLYFRGWHRHAALEPFAPDAEVMVNAAVHDIFSARWLLGAEPADVYVRGAVIDPARQVRELQLIAMTMHGGGLASIEINKDSGYGYEVGVEVVGSSGTVTSGPLEAAVVRTGAALRQSVDGDWLERFRTAYMVEAGSWVAAVRGGRPAGPSAWDGYATLVAAVAAVESLETSERVPVDLETMPTLYT